MLQGANVLEGMAFRHDQTMRTTGRPLRFERERHSVSVAPRTARFSDPPPYVLEVLGLEKPGETAPSSPSWSSPQSSIKSCEPWLSVSYATRTASGARRSVVLDRPSLVAFHLTVRETSTNKTSRKLHVSGCA
jgi:hypothetical protein